MISIHALLAESDGASAVVWLCCTSFLSTLSLRRATKRPVRRKHVTQDFYPRSPCGERQGRYHKRRIVCAISIHALLAESDKRPSMAISAPLDFYPRSPCGERPYHPIITAKSRYFYPRSPCGERRGKHRAKWFVAKISIHALLAESDGCIMVRSLVTVAFLSTLSLRRATKMSDMFGSATIISIHALLAESD